jgi:Ca-activated chloride channel family protein
MGHLYCGTYIRADRAFGPYRLGRGEREVRAMSGRRRSRHRVPRRTTPLGPAASVAAIALLLAAVGSGIFVLASGAIGAGCDGDVVLRVAADPGPVRPLSTIAADYNRGKPSVDGHCVTVAVTAAPAQTVVGSLAKGWPASAGPVPDVWVPESSDWVTLARHTPAAAALLTGNPTVIATTAVVIGMPKPMATAVSAAGKPPLTWLAFQDGQTDNTFWADYGHPEWGGLKVEFADSVASAATLQTIMSIAAVREGGKTSALTANSFHKDRTAQLSVLTLERNSALITKTTPDLLADLRKADAAGKTLTHASAIPILESDLVAYNLGVGPGASAPKTPLTAVYPAPTATRVDVPYALTTPASRDQVRVRAAAEFLKRVQDDAGQQTFSTDGFRASDGTPTAVGPGSGTGAVAPDAIKGETLAAAQTFFTAIHQRGASLAVVDVSGSMNEIVAGTNPPQTKAQVAANALVTALPLFAPDSEAGLWEFSTKLDNGKYYKELYPVQNMDSPGRDGPTHRDDLRELGSLLHPAGDTPLYAATLAAFRDRTANYVNGKLNLIFLLTDGVNDTPGDPNGITLDQLLKALRSEFDPKRPVRLVTIAYGPDADPGPLRQIAQATGAPSYQSRNPTDIFNVFVDALTEVT